MKTLYLGLDPPRNDHYIHYPIIKIQPIPFSIDCLDIFTHYIFTSKNAVRVFTSQYPINRPCIAIGKSTAQEISNYKPPLISVADVETQEGIIELIDRLNLQNPHFLWPHSLLSRDNLTKYLNEKKYNLSEYSIYTSVPHKPYDLPNLNDIEEIIFTSPSTINAFLHLFGPIPTNKKLTTIGPITQNHLNNSPYAKG